jgi:hypothetical protein
MDPRLLGNDRLADFLRDHHTWTLYPLRLARIHSMIRIKKTCSIRPKRARSYQEALLLLRFFLPGKSGISSTETAGAMATVTVECFTEIIKQKSQVPE